MLAAQGAQCQKHASVQPGAGNTSYKLWRELANLKQESEPVLQAAPVAASVSLSQVPKFTQQEKKKNEEQLFLQINYFSPMGNPALIYSLPPKLSTFTGHQACTLLPALTGSQLSDSSTLQPAEHTASFPPAAFSPSTHFRRTQQSDSSFL